ncbi:Chd64 [Bugula neritina]|uniref:Transgelin n=1 Tax=Bugula neritina TaxID=10212 RepID=A0A7J7IYS5_BUGNE|nr:Chd64 [Bugula neritina]
MNTSGVANNVYDELRSGQKLARLVNVISPGKISQKAIDGAKMTFKQMELINKFTDVCKSLGVPDHECFATVDLYEQQNMNQVITCLAALMRKFGLGPKEATKNEREFTEEQMKAGQTVIGLQMGTNRGASQAGMSFGKARHIVD